MAYSSMKSHDKSKSAGKYILGSVWQAMDGLPILGDVAKIRNGIQYEPSLQQASQNLVSKHPRQGFRPGLVRVSDGFEPLVIRDHVYLNIDSEVIYKSSKAYLFPWDSQKVILNSIRISRGPWVVTGAPDYDGLVVNNLFHGIWPTAKLPLEVIASIVNGPVANAFMSINCTSRHNRITTLAQVPVPNFHPESISTITALVIEYRSARLQWLAQRVPDKESELRCREILVRIDAELLTAYDLPPRVERELLDYFAGHRRPGPVEFYRYYPDDFRPAIPLRMIISGYLQRASAEQTLQRLPVLNDPVISKMVSELD